MLIASIVFLVIGFALYLGAFAQGPGPSMSDRPLQAWMFFGATACMVTGFLLIVAEGAATQRYRVAGRGSRVAAGVRGLGYARLLDVPSTVNERERCSGAAGPRRG